MLASGGGKENIEFFLFKHRCCKQKSNPKVEIAGQFRLKPVGLARGEKCSQSAKPLLLAQFNTLVIGESALGNKNSWLRYNLNRKSELFSQRVHSL